LSKFSGRTATLIGVGWVLNTGTPALSSDFESGDNMPFPMHISLILSPLEHGGISTSKGVCIVDVIFMELPVDIII
jgi:hypothetical protein